MQASQALKVIDCPADALAEEKRTSPQELLHLSTSVREQICSVSSLRIQLEKTVIKCTHKLASTKATETSTFTNGAYITDPVRFVSGLCLQSSLLVMGGDTGDGLTKM